MQTRVTISIDSKVYDGLVRTVGLERIGQFLEDLARPLVVDETLEGAYAAMAADADREQQALVFAEALIADGIEAPR
ncbi:hypothetical protein Sa4125_09750 [Aureimonas sp. SA4125]|uniref:hypothetical protein n=1 Tax=Aureimonas sp. SA4125 TaxID=2826993 RepID=UPI001CC56945|nr:hypothetical protein [Aureimonas sp. SA4125]BDA83433.1 hypothetical protein Sa4125_09750 [Aureimonas sp. SA4125]